MPATRQVALLFDPHRLDPQQRQLLAGIHCYAERAPHWQCVFDPHAIWGRRIPYDGLIAPGGTHTAPRSARAGVPAVLVTWLAFRVPHATRVVANRWMAARLAAEHLHRRGYQTFACVVGAHHAPSRIDRTEFRRWLRLRGLDADERRLTRRRALSSRDWQDIVNRLERWLGTLTPPVGIFCSTDAVARTLADLAAWRGLRVPEHVGLIGGGNHVPLCELEEPTLTSIDYHHQQVGRRAAELLDRLMDGQPPPRRNILITPTLVPRQSTDRDRFHDPLVARALDYIDAHSAEPIRVADVARASGLGLRQLQRRLKARRGRTIVQEILRARLGRAQRLLETTDAPLTAIARRAGFPSRRLLAAAFRRRLATTPTAYRREHRPAPAMPRQARPGPTP